MITSQVIGLKPPFDWETPHRSAARHSGHSLQLHDVGSAEG